jgi:hypothetical protein
MATFGNPPATARSRRSFTITAARSCLALSLCSGPFSRRKGSHFFVPHRCRPRRKPLGTECLRQCFDVAFAGDERIDDVRIEVRTALPANDADRLIVRHRTAIGPRGDERIVHVHYCQNASTNRDVFSCQPARIAMPVPPLSGAAQSQYESPHPCRPIQPTRRPARIRWRGRLSWFPDRGAAPRCRGQEAALR